MSDAKEQSPRSHLAAVGGLLLTLTLWPTTAHADCGMVEAEQMLMAFPDDVDSQLSVGEALACEGRCVEAWGRLEAAVEAGANAQNMRYAEQCLSRTMAGQSCEDRVDTARRFTIAEPDLALAHTTLADAMSCQDSCTEALPVLARAVELGAPADVLTGADLSCIDALIEQGEHTRAIAEIETAMVHLPKATGLHGSLITALSSQGQCVEARQAYTAAKRARVKPLPDDASGPCVARLVAAEKCDMAHAQAQDLIKLSPRAATPLALRGIAEQCLGRHRDAITSFSRYRALGGSKAKAKAGIEKSRAKLATLTVRMTAEDGKTKLPQPVFEGVPAELIKKQRGGVYTALDIDPGSVQVSVPEAGGYWPAHHNVTLAEGSKEELEIVLTRARYADLTLAPTSGALMVEVDNPRTSERVPLEAGQTTRVAAGSSTLYVTATGSGEPMRTSWEVQLDEGKQAIAAPWAWQVVNVQNGKPVAGAVEQGPEADINFTLKIPGGLHVPHSSTLTRQPGHLLHLETDPLEHPYASAKADLAAASRIGSIGRTTHWGALGSTLAVEALAIFEYSRALSSAAEARAIPNSAGLADYEANVALAQSTRRNAVFNALAGTALISVDLLWLRPKVKRQRTHVSSLRTAADEASKAPLNIRPATEASAP